ADFLPTAVIDRYFKMRVSTHRTMSREMFTRCFHPRLPHTTNKGSCNWNDLLRRCCKCTVADNFANTIYVEYWRKTNIDIHSHHLIGHKPPYFLRPTQCLFKRGCTTADRSHWRNLAKPFTETLDTSTFMVNGKNQRVPCRCSRLAHQLR